MGASYRPALRDAPVEDGLPLLVRVLEADLDPLSLDLEPLQLGHLGSGLHQTLSQDHTHTHWFCFQFHIIVLAPLRIF